MVNSCFKCFNSSRMVNTCLVTLLTANSFTASTEDSVERPKTLWPYPAPLNPTWQQLAWCQRSSSSPSHLWTVKQWRVTQVMTFFLISSSDRFFGLYFGPRASSSWLPSKHFLTLGSRSSPNFLIKSGRAKRSLSDPLEALSRTVPANLTVLAADESSKHGTMVVGLGSLFCSNNPLKTSCKISLSVKAKALSARTRRIINFINK